MACNGVMTPPTSTKIGLKKTKKLEPPSPNIFTHTLVMKLFKLLPTGDENRNLIHKLLIQRTITK